MTSYFEYGVNLSDNQKKKFGFCHEFTITINFENKTWKFDWK